MTSSPLHAKQQSSLVAQGLGKQFVVAIDKCEFTGREILPAEERHHQGPLIRQVLQPGHVEEGEVANTRSVLTRGVVAVLVPGVVRRDLESQHHPREEGSAETKPGVTGQFLKAEVTYLRVEEDGHKEERVQGGEVLDEGPRAHEDDSGELSHGHVTEDELLQPQLDVGEEETLVNPDNCRVVDQVQEEEVVQHRLADVRRRRLDRRRRGCLTQNRMDTDPRKELEDVVHAVRPHEPTAPEQKQDHCRGSHDRPVDVQRRHDRNHQEGDDHLQQKAQLHQGCRRTGLVQHVGRSRFHHQKLIRKGDCLERVVQDLIDGEHVKIEEDLPEGGHLLECEGDVIVLKGRFLLISHEHAGLIPPEDQTALIANRVVLILDHVALRPAVEGPPLRGVVVEFCRGEGVVSDVVELIGLQLRPRGEDALREEGVVREDECVAENESETEPHSHRHEQVEELLHPEPRVLVLQRPLRDAEEVPLNLHNYSNAPPRPRPPPTLNTTKPVPNPTRFRPALVYDVRSPYGETCPCCLRRVGSQRVPICTGTTAFLRISPEIPLFFSYVKVVSLVLVLFAVALGVQRMFSPSVIPVSFHFTPPEAVGTVYAIEIGFIESRRWVRFLFFLLFSTLILFVRGFLKKSKYEVTNLSKKLSDRSVMLTNVPRNASAKDIRQHFEDFQIEKVDLTYRVKKYIDSLQAVYRLKKACLMARKRKRGSALIGNLTKEITLKNEEIKMIKNRIKASENRLDFVFVTFRDEATRHRFLKKHQKGLLGRLFFKFCTCCSSTAIHGQHITVFPGPDAEDIDWLNLESGYWIKKTHRFACYYMSFAILVFGVLLQYEISTFPVQSLYVSIVKNLVVLVGNFLVVNLLEFTTFSVEKHEINTNKILSLVRKLTFFVFLNLSMSPLSIYLYYQFSSAETATPADTPFDELCLSILIISVGNISKPLTEYLNVGRVVSRLNFLYQRFLEEDCEMAQAEANSQFEPIAFPLASFYSLLLSALYLTAFFLSSFQLILAVEVLSCLILYAVSKYMLLRVCREPIGLNHMISVLCQRMIVFCIPLYWVGEKIMFFICSEQARGVLFADYLRSLWDVYSVIEAGLILFVLLFSATILSRISKRRAEKNQPTESFIERANQNQNAMTYEDVNSIKQLEEELKKYIDSVE